METFTQNISSSALSRIFACMVESVDDTNCLKRLLYVILYPSLKTLYAHGTQQNQNLLPSVIHYTILLQFPISEEVEPIVL
jgi:hypothetical protein